MEEHRLRPLLAPESVAVVGASPRAGTVSNECVKTLEQSGYTGEVTLINPKYDKIGGYVCRASLEAIGAPVDMVILAVGSRNLERVFEQALAAKARSLVIFDGCYLDGEQPPLLLERLRRRARETGVPVMGGNGMGFYNFDTDCHASFYPVGSRKSGGITMVAHSGSVATVLGFNDPRYRFNLLIASGQEIGASVADYVDYALGVPTTKVIALFMEAARDPGALVVALERAAERDIPVVICKVGRTEESARLALSHTGALTGSDEAFSAAVRQAGAIKVADLDELMSSAAFLSNGRRPGAGSFAAVTDSGGLRELSIDLAQDLKVPFAVLSEATQQSLRAVVPDILPISNPLDAAGPLDDGFVDVFANALEIMSRDESVAILAFETDVRDDFIYNEQVFAIAKNLPNLTEKPVVFFSSFGDVFNRGIADDFMNRGIPVISGLRNTLTAVRNALHRRDLLHLRQIEKQTPPPVLRDCAAITAARAALAAGTVLDEAASLDLLREADIAVARFKRVETLPASIEAAADLGYPVVLKTAAANQLHKTEVSGVRLNLKTEETLHLAYADLQDRLGPSVIVAEMAPAGVELAFGCSDDPDYGPLVSIGAGGSLVELLHERAYCLAPFGADTAKRLIAELRVAALLEGYRGNPAASLSKLAENLSRFSVLCAELRGCFTEIDVNPVIAGSVNAIAVDALFIGASTETA